MFSKLMFVVMLLSAVVVMPSALAAQTWYVDGAVSSSGDGTSWETAFKKIQEGIDAASDGDEVVVAPGTYLENIRFKGKNIILTSTNPLDPDIVGNTIIDGNEAGSVVNFSGTETEACILSGFTIRNGRTSGPGGGICGAEADSHTRATICHNAICGSLAQFGGGGIYACDGPILNNRIIGNVGGFLSGGGLSECDGVIRNNLVVLNRAGLSGGGLNRCGGEITNNTIVANSGGGLNPTGGLVSCHGTIRNCIIWGNVSLTGLQLSESSVPSYCCIQDWVEGGEGNITGDPAFADPDGPDNDPETGGDNDYRLTDESPCVEAGRNADWMWDAFDLDGNPRILPSSWRWKVDMGAYEHYIPIEMPMVFIVKRENGVQFLWKTCGFSIHIVSSSLDLAEDVWVEEATVYAEGRIGSWIDTSPLPRAKFYRCGQQ